MNTLGTAKVKTNRVIMERDVKEMMMVLTTATTRMLTMGNSSMITTITAATMMMTLFKARKTIIQIQYLT